MDRFTWKAPDETYQIDDYKVVHTVTCFDEDFKNVFTIYEGVAIDKLGQYEDLEEQDRLLVLPCKIGTKVYRIVPDRSVVWPDQTEYKVIWDSFKLNDIYEFGKTVFLDEEEAKIASKNKSK